MCDNPNYEQQKEEINNILSDTLGREIKCFNYDENYVMSFEGTMYDLDFNDWLELSDFEKVSKSSLYKYVKK